MRAIDGELLKNAIQCWIDTQSELVDVETCEIVLHAIDAMPTLTQPNEPLTLEQLRQMDAPVWCSCHPIEGGGGYWCLCQRGYIITPASTVFDAKEIPHWVFYRRPPEEEEES